MTQDEAAKMTSHLHVCLELGAAESRRAARIGAVADIAITIAAATIAPSANVHVAEGAEVVCH
eukprot:SAG25_NODE_4772_length_751_cov_0.966258_2_plen_63_part_00